jgi:hypothetical protein
MSYPFVETKNLFSIGAPTLLVLNKRSFIFDFLWFKQYYNRHAGIMEGVPVFVTDHHLTVTIKKNENIARVS